MNTTQKYKSTLVVWNSGENPVIESFYAESLDKLQELQKQWMDQGGYQEAKVHLYEMKDGEWHTLQKGDFRRMPALLNLRFYAVRRTKKRISNS